MISLRLLAAAVLAFAAGAGGLVILSGAFNSEAVQSPRMSLDMVTTDNSYSDPGVGGNNSMIVGAIDQCDTEALNNAAHNRTSNHLIIQNVEDLVGWQARMNYLGNRMRPTSFNSTTFTDSNTAQPVGFSNLPIDSVTLVHRSVEALSRIDRYPESSISVPSLAGATTINVGDATGFAPGQTIGIGSVADRETGRTVSSVSGNNISFSPPLVNDHLGLATEVVNVTDQTPQTALIGATYSGSQNFAISPDTPAKATPDDTSYTA